MKKYIPNKLMAFLLIKRSDQYIYGALLKRVLYQFSLVDDQYPNTITEAKQIYCQMIDLTRNYVKILETSIPVTRHAMILKIKIASQLYLLKNMQHAIFLVRWGIYHHIVQIYNQPLRTNIMWIYPYQNKQGAGDDTLTETVSSDDKYTFESSSRGSEVGERN